MKARLARLFVSVCGLMIFVMTNGVLWDSVFNRQSILGWPLLCLLGFVCVLVHELGHALAMLQVGGKVQEVMVLPFLVSFDPFTITVARAPGTGDLGGYAKAAFPRQVGRFQRIWISASGPIANILLAGAATLACIATFPFWPRAGGLLEALAILSAAIGVLNLVPFDGSDGSKIMHVLSRRGVRRSGA